VTISGGELRYERAATEPARLRQHTAFELTRFGGLLRMLGGAHRGKETERGVLESPGWRFQAFEASATALLAVCPALFAMRRCGPGRCRDWRQPHLLLFCRPEAARLSDRSAWSTRRCNGATL
jgi:hypothetical protein